MGVTTDATWFHIAYCSDGSEPMGHVYSHADERVFSEWPVTGVERRRRASAMPWCVLGDAYATTGWLRQTLWEVTRTLEFPESPSGPRIQVTEAFPSAADPTVVRGRNGRAK